MQSKRILIYRKIFNTLILFFHINAYSSKLDYIYPNRGPSFSNFGTVGLISMPTARFYQEGTVGFSWTRMDPSKGVQLSPIHLIGWKPLISM